MKYSSSHRVPAVLAVAALVVCGACMPPEEKPPTEEEMIARGQYLVAIGGCNDCHTPKVFSGGGPAPDHSRLLSGHPADLALPEYTFDNIGPGEWVLFNEHLTAAVGPWGVSFAANLTPHEDTGMGDWTAEEFIATPVPSATPADLGDAYEPDDATPKTIAVGEKQAHSF